MQRRRHGLLRRLYSASRANRPRRSMAPFYTQDDDPTVNASADANFLASLIKNHIASIRTTVLASYSSAKFELLWPYDVNFETCY